MNVYVQKYTSLCNHKYCNISTICRPINRTSKLVKIDIYFHPGVILKAPIYVEINAYKKFSTIYRPFMIKIKEELCTQLLLRNHILFKMAEPFILGELDATGNTLKPCPLSVCLTDNYSLKN